MKMKTANSLFQQLNCYGHTAERKFFKTSYSEFILPKHNQETYTAAESVSNSFD